ncbi:MAG: ATP-binding cassette domain-containing protein [Gemmatimonadota bacterium]
MPTGICMIILEHVGKTFRVAPVPGRKARVVEAVRDLSVSIEAGLVLGVVGPNGAGKTTLFGLLLGFLEASSGAIAIHGLDPRAYVRRHGASYLPERFTLPRDWTVRAALAALLQLDRAARAVDDVLSEYDLHAFASAPAHTLSRGTMQRAGIAQALAAPRDLVVLDEPTEGLDPIWRLRLRDAIHGLRADTRCVLIASHNLDEIERLADRVLILDSGRISESVELRGRPAHALDYTLVITASHPEIERLFPGCRAVAPGTYIVTAADAADLNARIAALIAAGASIVSLTPAPGLEQRVSTIRRQDG